MLHTLKLLIPPNTTESAPAEQTVIHTSRRLVSVSVLFPDGCLGVVGVRVLDDGRQIAPETSGWIYGNNNTVKWSDGKDLQSNRLTIQGVSDADDWHHSPIIYIEMI